jgi:hypothetical protein
MITRSSLDAGVFIKKGVHQGNFSTSRRKMQQLKSETCLPITLGFCLNEFFCNLSTFFARMLFKFLRSTPAPKRKPQPSGS